MSIQPRGGRKGGDFYYLATQFVTGDTLSYYPIWGSNLQVSGTETDADITADFGFLLRRFRVVLTENTATGSSVISFRRNAADVAGSAVTFLTTVIGEQVSGALSQMVSAGDLIDIRVDVTTAAAEQISGVAYAICQRVVD